MGYPTAKRFLDIAQISSDLRHSDLPSVLELGNQTLTIKEGDLPYLEIFFDRYGAANSFKKYKDMVGHKVHSADIYRDAGWNFSSLDLNGANNSLKIDLNIWPNNDLLSLANNYDLILNFGTTEHVSNQLNAFAILHYLCRTNGVILHHIPIVHYSSHAMNLITPKFIQKLIEWNCYEIIECRADHSLINSMITFHHNDSFGFMANFADFVECSTLAAIGYIVVQKKVNSAFVPPLDVAVEECAELRLLRRYITYYRLSSCNETADERLNKFRNRQPVSQRTKARPYRGRRAYLDTELVGPITRERPENKHSFAISLGGSAIQRQSTGAALRRFLNRTASAWRR